MNRITDIDINTLPNSLKNYKNILQLAELVAEAVNGAAADIFYARIWSRIDELSEELLDVLAYDLHIDWYDYSYSIEQKREIVKTSVTVHKKLGTRYAVETALKAAYPNSSIKAWYDDGGSGVPYTFDVVLDMSESGQSVDISGVSRIVYYYKSLRDRVGNIGFVNKQEIGLYTPVVLRQSIFQNVAPYEENDDRLFAVKARMGSVMVERKKTAIWCEIINPGPSPTPPEPGDTDVIRGELWFDGEIDSGRKGERIELRL